MAARPLNEAEKAHGFGTRWLKGEAWRLRGKLPGAEAALDRALGDALKRDDPGPWFAVPSPFAEAALGARVVITVDPRGVSRWLLSQADAGGETLRPRDHFFGGGDWAPLIKPVEEAELDIEAREIFASKGAIRSTPSFQKLARRLKQARGKLFHNGVWLRRETDLADYFIRQWALAESIRTHGFLAHDRARGTVAGRGRLLESRERDVGLAIAADGSLLRYRGGFHRFAYARAMGLAAMPAAVRLVHADWLRRQPERAPRDALLAGLKRLSLA